MKSVSRSRRFIACLLCVLTVVCLFPISHAEAAAISTTKEANMSKYSGNETGATWYWPIIGYSSQKAAYSDITSSYGYRHDPAQKLDAYHMGMDLADKTKLKKGTPVYSVREGKVRSAKYEGGYGNCVIVDHEDGYFSLYAHLNSLKVEKGDSVKLDTVIGTVGETGASQGVHLHLEIKYAPDKKYKNALNVNPCPPGYEKKGASLNTKAKGKGNGHPVGKGTINYEVKRPSSTTPASQYTISFNANGGTGAPGSQTKAHGQNLTLSSAKPTRDGYTFQGWATSSNGAVAYQAGATYSNNAAVTLYAVWKANSSGGLTPITSKPATVGSGYTTSGSAVKTLQTALNKVNNAGLTVDGKYGNNTKNAIINYQKKKGLTADGICGPKTWEKLIADYNALIKYTVTFDANGGSGAPGNQTKTYGQNLTLSSTKPTRTGHAFQGWATSSGGSVAYQPGSSYSNNAATTLYAVWKAESYTVSYNANGGSGAPGNQTKTYGQNLTLSSTRPTREGHTFQGWATSSGGAVAYQPGGTYSNNASVTLYAVWKEDTKYTLYLQNNYSGKNYLLGSDFASVDLNGEYWKSRDTSVSVISVDTTEKHNGYNSLKIVNLSEGSSGKDLYIRTVTNSTQSENWIGDKKAMTLSFWAKSSVNGTKIHFRWGYESVYTTVTLSTGWTKYTIRMDKQLSYGNNLHPYIDRAGTVWIAEMQIEDGTSATAFVPEPYTTVSKMTYSTGSSYPAPADPVRTGYTFDGWYTAAFSGSKVSFPMVVPNGHSNLYAHWSPVTYSVSYNANGGSGAPANQTKTYGQNLTLSSTRPTRDGYTFQGWATSAGGAATYQPGSNYSDNAAVTLYAVWKETSSVKTYTISYKVPEGQVAPEPQIKTHGVNLKLTTFVPVAPKGHSFVGWLNYPAAIKGNEPIYGPGAFYYEDSSATLTAVFEPNKYRISYEANGGSGVPGYQIKRYGNDISISQLVPEREGYTFQGWATSAGGTAVYQPGSTYSDNADVTLYAVWKQNGDAKRLPGDVNDDGKVSLLDLARLCKYLAGYNVNIHELNSDVNGDGKVSLLDLARLCKHLAGYDVVLK